jgi:hypothetical protein
MALNPEHSVPPRRTHGIPSQYEEFGVGEICDSASPLYCDPQVGAVPDWGVYSTPRHSQFYSQLTPSFGPSSESIAIALHHT